MSVLLEAQALGVMRGERRLVHDLSFQLSRGERLAILGKNGAGKSSLLHTLAGLDAPAAGHVQLAGKPYSDYPARQAARLRALLPQQQADTFGASVLEAALIGRHPHLSRWAVEGAIDERIARENLAAVGLDHFAHRTADSLSGGERQRLSIATLLTQGSDLMLLDEPLTHLDLGSQVPMLDLLCARAGGGALAMVLHEPTLARRFCTHALVLFDGGEWLFGPASEVITVQTLTRVHGHHFHQLQDGDYRVFVPA